MRSWHKLLCAAAGALLLAFAGPAVAAVTFDTLPDGLQIHAGRTTCKVLTTGTIKELKIDGALVIEEIRFEVREEDGTPYVPTAANCKELEVAGGDPALKVTAQGTIPPTPKGIECSFRIDYRFSDDGRVDATVVVTPLVDFRAQTCAYLVELPLDVYAGQPFLFSPRDQTGGPFTYKEGYSQRGVWPATFNQYQFQWFVPWIRLQPKQGPPFEMIFRHGTNVLEDLRQNNVQRFCIGSWADYKYPTVTQGDARLMYVTLIPLTAEAAIPPPPPAPPAAPAAPAAPAVPGADPGAAGG